MPDIKRLLTPSDPRHARGDSKSLLNALTVRRLSNCGAAGQLDGTGTEPLKYPGQSPPLNGIFGAVQIVCDSAPANPVCDCADEKSDVGAFARNSPNPPRMTASGGPPSGDRKMYWK